MYRPHNVKIRVYGKSKQYELFLLPENAEHIIKREHDGSHQVSLMQTIALAGSALYIEQGKVAGKRIGNPTLVYGLVIYRNKYYQVVGYITELYGGRFVLETCYVVSNPVLREACEANHDLLTTVEFSDNGKITRHRNPPPQA